MPLRTPALTLTLIAAVILGAGTAFGQTPAAAESQSLAAAAAAAARATELQPPPAKTRKNPVIIGAIVGAIGAAALTAMYAKQYGENESGGFCGACFAYWSPLAIPAGAGIGAGIGWAVKAGLPDPQPAGLPPSTTASAGWRQDAAVTIRF